jgi:dihydrofolate reductase
MTIIAALSHNHVIGMDNAMPWHVPEEYGHFLNTIKNQTVIMGRASFAIFGPTLTSAHAVVVSRGKTKIPGVVVAPSIERAVEIARSFGKEIYIAGGAEIYRQMMPLADRMLLSFVKDQYAGNKFFPQIGPEWKIVRKEDVEAYELVEYIKI